MHHECIVYITVGCFLWGDVDRGMCPATHCLALRRASVRGGLGEPLLPGHQLAVWLS
jgi:hypothetical protein